MPILAASEVVLYIILASVAVLFVWTVGHEVEKDVTAIGDAAHKNAQTLTNPIFIAGAVLTSWFLFKAFRKGKVV